MVNMTGKSRKSPQGPSPKNTSNTTSKKYAILKKPSNKAGVQKVTDVLQEGSCLREAVFRLQVTEKREFAKDTFEFTLKEGSTTAVGISFGCNGGPGPINNKLLREGYTYHVRATRNGEKIRFQLRKSDFKQRGITSKYEIVLPKLEILLEKANRPSKNLKSKLNTIIELNQLIESGGKFYREGNLTNVTITKCEFRRYKGCHACKTRIQDPIHKNKRLLCPKCQKKAGDKREDGKWKMFMTLKDFCFKDDVGNTFRGGIAFHEECKKILANFCGNYDELFDEQANEVAKNNLVGAKVDVSIKIDSAMYREAGTRSTDLKIVVSRLKILAAPQPSENGMKIENEPQPSTSRGRSVYTASRPSNFEPVEPMDEESARVVDYDNSDGSHSTGTTVATHQDHIGLIPSEIDSVSYGQPDQSDQSDSESATDSEQCSPKPIVELWPDYEELKQNVNFDQIFRLRKCGAMIVHIYTTELDDGTYDERLGSEEDVQRLKDLFTDTLDVELFGTFKDLKSTDLAENLESYKDFLEEINADSMILFFSGHGKQNSIILSDGQHVNFYADILTRFSDQDFPQLAGKPKMFFPLGCQDFDDESLNADFNGFLALDYSATLISLPQLSGNKVARCKRTGTAFVKYFCQIVRQHSAESDIMDLIKRTNAIVENGVKVRRKSRPDLPNQVPQPQTIGFHAKYYFKLRHQSQTDLPVRIADGESDNAVMDFSSA